MGIFLAIKQIIDMLYQFKFLDILMVLFVIVLISFKLISIIKKEKKKEKKKENESFITILRNNINVVDILVFALGLMFAISVLRYPVAYTNGIKIESALLVYFLGRLYGKGCIKYTKVVAAVSYVLIYLNAAKFFYKLISYIVYGETIFFEDIPNLRNNGGFYFYKTDLAFAILIGTIFIYIFSELKTFKKFTVFVFNPIFIFNTAARAGQLLYLVLVFLIIIFEIYKKKQINKKGFDDGIISEKKSLKKVLIIIVNSIFAVLAVIVISAFFVAQFTDVKKYSYDELELSGEQREMLENKFHSREVIWWDTCHYLANNSIVTELFGENLDDIYFAEHNGANRKSHSIYLTILFSVGFIGMMLFLAIAYFISIYLVKNKNMQMVFLCLTSWMLLLLGGFSVDTIEYTQISWLPFIFAGMSVTEKISIDANIEKQNKKQ